MIERLPLGIQSFPQIIEGGYIYVDKTAYIHQLITTGKFYFLSRPRRFGKSVLISTLEALFRGRRDLFEGLFIADRWDFAPRPVIRLDFIDIKTESLTVLAESLNRRLDETARAHGVTLTAPDSSERLRELIRALAREGPVVVLVDEYDKPILEQITNREQAERNRRFLAKFYAVLKGRDLEFLFMTGVSKFTHVSLFSELNNLEDITLDTAYAGIAGYAEAEVAEAFAPFLEEAIDGFAGEDLRNHIRTWYNGYSWDGQTRVYNPVSLLSFFKKKRFSGFWFSTGTPRFLVELLREHPGMIPTLEDLELGDAGVLGGLGDDAAGDLGHALVQVRRHQARQLHQLRDSGAVDHDAALVHLQVQGSAGALALVERWQLLADLGQDRGVGLTVLEELGPGFRRFIRPQETTELLVGGAELVDQQRAGQLHGDAHDLGTVIELQRQADLGRAQHRVLVVDLDTGEELLQNIQIEIAPADYQTTANHMVDNRLGQTPRLEHVCYQIVSVRAGPVGISGAWLGRRPRACQGKPSGE